MYLGRCLSTPAGGVYKIAIHGSCLCIHAFPNGVVPRYQTTWQLHLHPHLHPHLHLRLAPARARRPHLLSYCIPTFSRH